MSIERNVLVLLTQYGTTSPVWNTENQYFAVSLLRVSPTAVGLISDLDAFDVLLKATRFPPAMKLDMESWALGPASN